MIHLKSGPAINGWFLSNKFNIHKACMSSLNAHPSAAAPALQLYASFTHSFLVLNGGFLFSCGCSASACVAMLRCSCACLVV